MQWGEGVVFTHLRRLPGIWKLLASEKQPPEQEKNRVGITACLERCHKFSCADFDLANFYCSIHGWKSTVIPTLIRLPFIVLLPLRGWRRTFWRIVSPSSSRVNLVGALLVNLHIVVEDFAFFVALDGLTGFLVQYFQHVLCTVDNKRASRHGNQVIVLSELVLLLCWMQFPNSFADRPIYLRCSLTRMVFQGECVVLFNFLFCPTFKQRATFDRSASVCHLSRIVSHEPSFGTFGFSWHITRFVIHHLMHCLTMSKDLRIGSSLSRTQETTMCQICLCCIVDSSP